jgi:hypothetical protein
MMFVLASGSDDDQHCYVVDFFRQQEGQLTKRIDTEVSSLELMVACAAVDASFATSSMSAVAAFCLKPEFPHLTLVGHSPT